MSYCVKNMKTGPSREFGPGGSYTCNLYNGNKKIAEVFEAGDGGELDVRWIGDRTETVERNGYKFKATTEEVAFSKFCETQTYVGEWDGKTRTYTPDLYIAKLADEYLTNRQIKGWCRNKTVVRMKSDGEGQFSTFNAKFSEKVKAALTARYGNDILEFVNERFA